MPNLVGIGNSQVPTNAMLGGLAYQDSVGEIDIEKIKARTSDTAVDVFVYDTRKDSDGGAWRHRTQNKSWYNESASQKRGSRKEFPAVAVIVCLSNYIKIYDGDDPNLPLWMEVRPTTNRRDHGWMKGSTLNAVTALNGIIAIAANGNIGDEGGLLLMDFVKDELRRHDDGTSRSGGGLSISQRGTSADLNVGQNVPVIVDAYVTAITMTLLPNAPIDASTELPIPTIIAGTRRGISVVRDSGVVYDMLVTVNSGLNYETNSIKITKDLKIIHNWDDRVSNAYSSISIIPLSLFESDSSYGFEYQFRNEGVYGYNVGGGSLDIFNAIATYFVDAVPTELGYFAIGSNKGLVNIQHIPQALNDGGRSSLGDARFSGGMHCRITNNFNTGWLFNDIKGAFLSSTDDTNLTDTNLVTNGDFSNGSTGWSLYGLTVNTSGNNMVLTSTSGNQRISQAITVEPEQTYYFRVTSSGNKAIYVSKNTVSNQALTNRNNSHFTVPAGTTTVYVVLYVIGTGNSATFDDVIVTKADPDRSVNNQPTNNGGQGLRVFGTITKIPVATGAELVSYNGFNASNGLIQPYNSDLDFGTGDYYMSIWAYGGGSGQVLMIREHGTSDADGSILLFQQDNKYAFYSRQDGTTSWTYTLSSTGYGARWNHVTMVRTGGTLYGYVNGKLETSTSFSGNVTNNDATLNIGRRNPSVTTQYFTGSLALARIGISAPTDEQIKKMYDDEKCLFHEDAKCTLHGTSDDVKALAFDDTTNVLHVGTSSGRSQFQGLNRINNTTTAVTTAISVSNEFVAEQ